MNIYIGEPYSQTTDRNDHIAWCHEELQDLVEALEFAKLNGNKPAEVLNIAAQMSVIVSQLALAAGE
ncbi:MAG: hypothetical protein IPM37_23240 [Hahellaceae bacterium]|nr:hypothetical protein [Hahellaceae bacterium]